MITTSQIDSAWRPVTLARASGTVVTAHANGQTYRISLSVPATPPPPGGFPSLVVLDGAALFATAAETERRLSNRPEVTGVDPTVIIGVGHDSDALYDTGQRYRDFTPGPSTAPDVGGHVVGGADGFHDVLLDQVLPLVERTVGLNPDRRALLGHSFAGYFTLHALLRRPEAFAAYGAVSPSVWWDPDHIARGLAALALPAPRLSITVGALEQPEDASAKAARRMVDAARTVADAAREAGLPQVEFTVLPDENHASVVTPAITRFLRFAGAPQPV